MHGISGVIPEWTGAKPAPIVASVLNPIFLVVPLIAFIVLLRKKLSVDYIWLGFSAIVFGFLAKTTTRPFGFIYQLLYSHFPSFNLFREGSKFLFPVAMALSILVPSALQDLWDRRIGLGRTFARISRSLLAPLALAVIVVVFAATSWSQLNGSLKSTTVPVNEPSSFSQLTAMLSRDQHPGQVLWLGTPRYFDSSNTSHIYNISSPLHPLDLLRGNTSSQVVIASDPFQTFCNDLIQPYCYLNSTLFPYLISQTNTAYLVSPKGTALGSPDGGVSDGWLKNEVDAIYGAPQVLGSGDTAIYVWHLPTTYSVVRNYPAIGVVYGGPWTLLDDLPAIEAFHLQVTFTATYNQLNQPVASASYPDSLAIDPFVNGLGYRNVKPARYTVLAKTSDAKVSFNINGSVTSLPRVTTLNSAPGWSAYGPITFSNGNQYVSGSNVTLGPAVQWDTLAQHALQSSVLYAPPQTAPNDQSYTGTFPKSHGPWYELAVNYDTAWKVGGTFTSGFASQLFNLFYLPKAPHQLVFTYSSYQYQLYGIAISLIGLLGIFVLLRISKRRRYRDLGPEARLPQFESEVMSPALARIAIALMSIAVLAQIYASTGLPSKFPWTSLNSDPYLLPITFTTSASLLVTASLSYRLVRRFIRIRVHLAARDPRGTRAKWKAISLSALGFIISSCGLAPTSTVNQSISIARSAGAPSPKLIGNSIADARLSFAVKDAQGCIANYTNAIQQYPDFASLYIGRAQCYASPGVHLLNGMLSDAARAVALRPTDANVLFFYTETQIGAGEDNHAFQSAVKLASSPNASPQLLQNIIDLYILRHQYYYAHRTYEVASQLFPNNPIILIAEAHLQTVVGNESGAVASIDRALTLSQSAQFIRASGIVKQYACQFFITRHDYTRANQLCTAALKTAPNQSGLLDDLAAIAADQGNLGAAIAYEKSSIQYFIVNVGPYAQPSGVSGLGISRLQTSLGRYELAYGNTTAATRVFARALSNVPPNYPDTIAGNNSLLKASKASYP